MVEKPWIAEPPLEPGGTGNSNASRKREYANSVFEWRRADGAGRLNDDGRQSHCVAWND